MAGLGMGLFCGLVATFVDEFVMAVGAGFMLGFVFRAFTGPANQQILSGRLSWPLDGLALGLVGWPVAVLVVGFPRGMSTGPLIGMPGPLSIAAERLRSGLLFGSLSDIGFGLLVGVALGLLCGLIGWLADALPHGPVRHRWVAVMSVVPMALLGGLLGGSMLGPAGELGFGVAGGFGFGAAASLVRLRNPEADLGGWRDAVVVNVTNRTRDGLVGGVLGGITGVLSAWLTGTVPSGMTTAAADGLVDTLARPIERGLEAGLALGAVIGLVLGLVGTPVGRPTRVSIRLRGRAQALLVALAQGLALGLGGGLGFALTFGTDRKAAAALGLVGGVAIAFGTWLRVPLPDAPAANLASVLRADRTATLVGALIAGVGVGTVTWLAAGPIWALMATPIGAISVAGSASWTHFAVGRAWYGLTGRLPWRLMTYLEDAHKLGVLRQAGPVYQFRHARLRERLSFELGRPPIIERSGSDKPGSRRPPNRDRCSRFRSGALRPCGVGSGMSPVVQHDPRSSAPVGDQRRSAV